MGVLYTGGGAAVAPTPAKSAQSQGRSVDSTKTDSSHFWAAVTPTPMFIRLSVVARRRNESFSGPGNVLTFCFVWFSKTGKPHKILFLWTTGCIRIYMKVNKIYTYLYEWPTDLYVFSRRTIGFIRFLYEGGQDVYVLVRRTTGFIKHLYEGDRIYTIFIRRRTGCIRYLY